MQDLDRQIQVTNALPSRSMLNLPSNCRSLATRHGVWQCRGRSGVSHWRSEAGNRPQRRKRQSSWRICTENSRCLLGLACHRCVPVLQCRTRCDSDADRDPSRRWSSSTPSLAKGAEAERWSLMRMRTKSTSSQAPSRKSRMPMERTRTRSQISSCNSSVAYPTPDQPGAMLEPFTRLHTRSYIRSDSRACRGCIPSIERRRSCCIRL